MGAYGAYRLALDEKSEYSYVGAVFPDFTLGQSMEKAGFSNIEEAVFGFEPRWDMEEAAEECKNYPQMYLAQISSEAQKYADMLTAKCGDIRIEDFEEQNRWTCIQKSLRSFLQREER